MDYLAEHQRMLELAAVDKLPERISDKRANSELSATVCRELYEAGLIDAADAASKDGLEYLHPRITIRGREYLNGLQERSFEASPAGKAKKVALVLGGWLGGILTAVLAAWILARLGLTENG